MRYVHVPRAWIMRKNLLLLFPFFSFKTTIKYWSYN